MSVVDKIFEIIDSSTEAHCEVATNEMDIFNELDIILQYFCTLKT